MITIIAVLVAVTTTILISRHLNNKKIDRINEAHDAQLITTTIQLFNSAERLGMLYKRTEDTTIAEMLNAINS
jgi:hypothetical protein